MDESRRNSHEMKVQFAKETKNTDTNSDIQVQVLNSIVINVQLGFLQIDHKYEIKFHFELPESLEDNFQLDKHSTSNIQIIELILAPEQTKEKMSTHLVTVHLSARKDKLLKETISLQLNQSKVLTFIFHARVLGKDKGTPFLKNGIKCIGFNPEDEE